MGGGNFGIGPNLNNIRFQRFTLPAQGAGQGQNANPMQGVLFTANLDGRVQPNPPTQQPPQQGQTPPMDANALIGIIFNFVKQLLSVLLPLFGGQSNGGQHGQPQAGGLPGAVGQQTPMGLGGGQQGQLNPAALQGLGNVLPAQASGVLPNNIVGPQTSGFPIQNGNGVMPAQAGIFPQDNSGLFANATGQPAGFPVNSGAQFANGVPGQLINGFPSNSGAQFTNGLDGQLVNGFPMDPSAQFANTGGFPLAGSIPIGDRFNGTTTQGPVSPDFATANPLDRLFGTNTNTGDLFDGIAAQGAVSPQFNQTLGQVNPLDRALGGSNITDLFDGIPAQGAVSPQFNQTLGQPNPLARAFGGENITDLFDGIPAQGAASPQFNQTLASNDPLSRVFGGANITDLFNGVPAQGVFSPQAQNVLGLQGNLQNLFTPVNNMTDLRTFNPNAGAQFAALQQAMGMPFDPRINLVGNNGIDMTSFVDGTSTANSLQERLRQPLERPVNPLINSFGPIGDVSDLFDGNAALGPEFQAMQGFLRPNTPVPNNNLFGPINNVNDLFDGNAAFGPEFQAMQGFLRPNTPVPSNNLFGPINDLSDVFDGNAAFGPEFQAMQGSLT